MSDSPRKDKQSPRYQSNDDRPFEKVVKNKRPSKGKTYDSEFNEKKYVKKERKDDSPETSPRHSPSFTHGSDRNRDHSGSAHGGMKNKNVKNVTIEIVKGDPLAGMMNFCQKMGYRYNFSKLEVNNGYLCQLDIDYQIYNRHLSEPTRKTLVHVAQFIDSKDYNFVKTSVSAKALNELGLYFEETKDDLNDDSNDDKLEKTVTQSMKFLTKTLGNLMAPSK
jgi:hypothetical protein